jgi:hypothetical protein
MSEILSKEEVATLGSSGMDLEALQESHEALRADNKRLAENNRVLTEALAAVRDAYYDTTYADLAVAMERARFTRPCAVRSGVPDNAPRVARHDARFGTQRGSDTARHLRLRISGRPRPNDTTGGQVSGLGSRR